VSTEEGLGGTKDGTNHRREPDSEGVRQANPRASLMTGDTKGAFPLLQFAQALIAFRHAHGVNKTDAVPPMRKDGARVRR